MKIKQANNDLQSMSQDGDAILRSLQNKTMPTIDLMVRESLQNSLDATLPDVESTNVTFHVDFFDTEKLAKHFEGIEETLNRRFRGPQRVIAVSDKNTLGLTGDYKSDDNDEFNRSNFQKLVFGIGKNQDKAGAGGSWGLGKTSYFRLGQGIVLYYSRVSLEDNYEERLIASLIESPKQAQRILPENHRGIAWWGEYGENPNKLLPITDHDQIAEILSIFNLKPYENEETGTTIIIPFVEDLNEGEIEKQQKYPWMEDYHEAIKMAVQRWYTPRLMNKAYRAVHGNSYLMCKVNQEVIMPNSNTEPVFNVIQKLYNSALINKPVDANIKVIPIDGLSNVLKLKGAVGHIAFTEVSYDDLKMTAPENKPSALVHLGLDYNDSANGIEGINKVLAYSRKPGMVIEYSVTNDWLPANITLKEDHYLFAFFVPNSAGELKTSYKEMGYNNLEAYLRATENADHATWADEDSITIIKRIKTYTMSSIQKTYIGEEKNNSSSATSALSRKFGSMLMPPKGFGKSGRKPPGGGGGVEGPKKGPKPTLLITKTDILDDRHIELTVDITLVPKSTNKVYIYIMGQDQKIDAHNWEQSFEGTVQFPYVIKSVEVTEGNQYTAIKTREGITSELHFDSKDTDKREIKVKFIIQMNSHQYQPLLGIKTEKQNDKREEL
ncbi:hypothetical protein ERX27_02480 [Macrococcus brunensis]|uniref:Uncharacterized protein n=1 Tax=Macrococcus brunensis TaxID=198483 RepID=A0A4R6BFR0_9STAP|nr:hypothetical protein [Macrococcus brunensis]TDL98662.1 hypothetical protein ERX27_02480 [Macrococcus brunensis]